MIRALCGTLQLAAPIFLANEIGQTVMITCMMAMTIRLIFRDAELPQTTPGQATFGGHFFEP